MLALGALLAVAGTWWNALPSPVLAVGNGQLEQGLFVASVLALMVAWFERSTTRAVAAGVLAVAAPVAVWALLPADDDFGVLSWVLGIGFRGC